MTTTIKSTELDYQTIKENLKTYLQNTGEFNDYDFDGSGISTILDVLAYNTHYNALQTNFALNESFLVTAQLRPSVISLSESLGYVPDSKKSAEATISLTINATDLVGLEENYVIKPGEVVLRGTRDNLDFTFTNRVSLVGRKVSGIYSFSPLGDPDRAIVVYEGEKRNLQFIVGNSNDSVYVLPDQEMDISTAIVKVYEDQGSAVTPGSEFNTFTNLLDATTIDSQSRLYVLRESPNAYYEVSFGNGTSLGVAPSPGNVVEVDYLRTSGEPANGISYLELISSITLGQTVIDPNKISVTVATKASAGGEKEGIESIRKNAPFQFASQNRMVTSDDYSTLILKKYSPFIEDIQSWGGEDDPKPDYGTVFTSIVWKEDLSPSTITNTRQGIIQLADQFQIASFRLNFTDPIVTYISTEVFFQFNPSLSGVSPSAIRADVDQSIVDYFIENTGKFSQVFRESNLLTAIDATDPSVLSSRCSIILNRRIIPQLATVRDYSVAYPSPIRDSQASNSASVFSSQFAVGNKTVFIRNKLNKKSIVSGPGVVPIVYEIAPSTELELVDVEGNVVIDNIGSYNSALGTVTITSLEVQSVPTGTNYIKIFAIPANQSVVNSVRNNIVKYDPDQSFTQAVIVDTR